MAQPKNGTPDDASAYKTSAAWPTSLLLAQEIYASGLEIMNWKCGPL